MKISPAKVFLCCAVIATAGCGGRPVGLVDDTSSEVVATVSDARVAVKERQTSQKEVREQLGTPMLSSVEWDFDLYRIESSDTVVYTSVLPPLIFPGGSSKFIAYLLIAYYEDGIVQAVDIDYWADDVRVELSDGISEHLDYEDARAHLAEDIGISLVAGEVTFDARHDLGSFNHRRLRASSRSSRHKLIEPAPPEKCLVFLTNTGVAAKFVSINGIRLIERSRPYIQSSYLRLGLPKGRHRLVASRRTSGNEVTQEFECRGGESIYLEIAGQFKRSQGVKSLLSMGQFFGDVQIANAPTAPFDNARMTLYFDDKWWGSTNWPP